MQLNAHAFPYFRTFDTNMQSRLDHVLIEVRASQLAQASESVGSLIPASQQG